MQPKLFGRDFLLLLAGQLFSLMGNYTLKFALSMYVLEKTGSAEIFGAVLAVSIIPTVLLSPLGGVLADRMNRRTLMAGLDALSGAAVLAGTWGIYHGNGLGTVVGLQIFLGILGAFESPVVQACVPQLHSGENLLRANALVNEIQSVAGMVTPFAGGLLYSFLGIGPVLLLVSLCFIWTAFLECWIRLPKQSCQAAQSPFTVLRMDLSRSIRFLRREEPMVLRLVLLAAMVNLLASGCITVGLPFLVRSRLGLSAAWYGAAESVLGLASVLGGVLVTLLASRLSFCRAYWLLGLFGGTLFPVALTFAVTPDPLACYSVLVLAMAVSQIGCSIFSVLGLCEIQSRTPSGLTGKVMAFVLAIAQCAQPLGQTLYGFLWDRLPVWMVLAGTGMILLAVTGRSRGVFRERPPAEM